MSYTDPNTSQGISAASNYSYIVLTVLLLLTVGATLVYYRSVGAPDGEFGTPVVFLVGLCVSLLLFGMTHRDSAARSALDRRTLDLLDTQKKNQALLEAEQAARQEAERANRAKNEFLAVVSHELRTPLNAIAGWTRILQDPDLSQEARLKALEKIDKNLRIQAEIVEELLNFSEIMSSGPAAFARSIAIQEVVEEAIASVRSAARQKGVELDVTNLLDSERVTGDRRRLKIAIANVLTNAVKFTPRGGSVKAKAYAAAGGVKCVITDNGSGISPEFLPHIFEQYKQSEEPQTRHYGGLGLGLTMAERIVKLHGGSIEAESSGIGNGAKFTISLPMKSDARVH